MGRAERGKEGTSHCASAANARASGYDTIAMRTKLVYISNYLRGVCHAGARERLKNRRKHKVCALGRDQR